MMSRNAIIDAIKQILRLIEAQNTDPEISSITSKVREAVGLKDEPLKQAKGETNA